MKEWLEDRYNKKLELIVKGTPHGKFDVENTPEIKCLNCGTVFKGNFCPCCGQSSKVQRLTFKHVLDNLMRSFMKIENGLARTCWELIYRPGYMIRDYIDGHRVNYVRPVRLLFLLASIFIIVHYVLFLHAEPEAHFFADEEAIEQMPRLVVLFMNVMNTIFANRALSSLLMVFVLLVPYWLAFRNTNVGKRITIAEFFFVMVFLACQQMVFNILSLPFERLFSDDKSAGVGFSLLLTIWVFHQFFDVGWKRSIIGVLIGAVILLVPIAVLVGAANIIFTL